MAALQLIDVGYRFAHGPTVLQGVSLTLAAGEMLALIGPNGAGKSTLLRRAAGLLPGPGAVLYGGVTAGAKGWRALARCRAVVPQQESQGVPYTVAEMVAQGLAHRHGTFRAPRAAAAVQEVLQEVGFEPPLSRRFIDLSGGERQLVLVARALLQEAPVLLLDEPQSRLDLRHRAAVMLALRRRARAGMAVLISLHDLNLAALTCDRLLLLAAGRPVVLGAPQAVLQAPVLQSVYRTAVSVGQHPTAATPTVELDLPSWDAAGEQRTAGSST